jgi:hypothetical protein
VSLRALATGLLLSLAPCAAAAQTVDTVIVSNGNVFGPQDDAPPLLARIANALHVPTRDATIRRALLVRQGQPYDSALLAESERNLRGLGVFRDVRLDTVRLADSGGPGRFALAVRTADGWSTKPQVQYRTSAGSATWRAGMVEENFLGTATQVFATYGRTPDRSEIVLGFVDPVLTRHRAILALQYWHLSDGDLGLWVAGLPFTSATSHASALTSGFVADDRVLVYRRGVAAGYGRRAVVLEADAGLALRATSRGYVRVWVRAVGGRYDFAPEGSGPLPRSHFATAGAGLEGARLRYVVVQNANAFARREDVDASIRFRAGLWALPSAWGYSQGHAGLGAELSGQVAGGSATGAVALAAFARGVRAGGALDSGRVQASLAALTQVFPRQTLVASVTAGAAHHANPGGQYDLWQMLQGPRLYGAHALTGTRAAWATIEDRVLVSSEFMGLIGIGLAPFADWGLAWYPGDPRLPAGDAGLALRLGTTRSTHGEVVEIAVGRRFGPGSGAGGWALAIGTGYRFLSP